MILKAGVARVDITPSPGSIMACFPRRRDKQEQDEKALVGRKLRYRFRRGQVEFRFRNGRIARHGSTARRRRGPRRRTAPAARRSSRSSGSLPESGW